MRVKFPPKILIAIVLVMATISIALSERVTNYNTEADSPVTTGNNLAVIPLACNSNLQITLDENCEAVILPDMILEGTYDDYNEFEVNILNPVGQPIGNVADGSMIGRQWLVRVTHIPSGNSCTAYNITFVDYGRPTVDCRDIAVDCLSAVDDIPPPQANDNCDPSPDLQLISQTYEDNSYCDNDTIVILRNWMAVDQYGNQSDVCTQRISVYRVQLDFPKDITWSCAQYDAFPSIINATPLNPAITDTNPYEGQDDIDVAADLSPLVLANTGSGVPTGYTSNLTYCDYNVTYVDDTLAHCGGSTMKIIRRWIVIDMCSFHIEYHNQIILIDDSEGPVIENNSPVTVSANVAAAETGNVCRSTAFVPFVATVDDCSGVTSMQIFTPAGEVVNYQYDANGNVTGGYIPAPGIPLGTYPGGLIYTAEDACGNITRQQVDLEVIDDISPSAVCEAVRTVVLNNTGVAEVAAISFDDGSNDNCCLDHFEVRRVESACPDYSEEDDAGWWGSSVHFCCEDVGTAVEVEMKAVDCFGNSTSCEVTVNVQDNTAPVCNAPADMTFLCNDLPGNIDLNDPVEMNARFGTPTADDNCGALIEYLSVIDTRNECGIGTITRRFRASDENGNVSEICQQTITTTAIHDYTIHLPADAHAECSADGIVDTLSVEHEGCDLLAIGYEDDTLAVSGNGSCYELLRTYTILNECEFDFTADPPAEILERKDFNADGSADAWDAHFSQATAPNTAKYQYTQLIKVGDTQGPVITYHGDTTFYTGDDCLVEVTLPVDVTDNCEVVATNWTFGTNTTLIDTGSGIFNKNVSPGDYQVIYSAEDGCGSVTYLPIHFSVLDTLPPNISIHDTLVFEADENGGFTLTPEDLLISGTDNCCENTYEVRITDAGNVCVNHPDDDTFNTSVSFCCENLNAPVNVELRATDCHGNSTVRPAVVTVNDVTAPECVAPADMSIPCTQVPGDLTDTTMMDNLFGAPAAVDNCSATVEHLEVIDGRNECNSGIIRRRFKTTDSHGNESVCLQEITVTRVHDYTLHLPADQETDCNLSNITPLTYDIGGCDLVGMTYEDVETGASGNGCYTVERTYTVTIFCEYDIQNNLPAETLGRVDADGNGLAEARDTVFTDVTSPHTGKYTYTQHLIVVDTLAPVVAYSGNNVFYVDDNCSATVALPVTVSDDCGNTTVTWTFPNDDDPVNGEDSGFRDTDEEGSGIFSRTLTVGDYHVTYHVADDCGNTTDLTVNFSVRDTIPPVANCKSDFVVHLDENGVATVIAPDLNDGSTDNCCLNHFEIKRNETTCGGHDEDLNFAANISFCCEDVGNDVLVTLKAIDCHGNESTCTTTVEVVGMVPQCVAPVDTSIACTDVPGDLTDTTVMDAVFGAPQVAGGCFAQVTHLEVIDNRDDCHSGTIIRKFSATDGNSGDIVCQQTITVNRVHEYTLYLPVDQEVDCNLSGVTPVTVDIRGCDTENITYEDQTIGNTGHGCYTVERTYRIAIECDYDADNPPTPISFARLDADADGIAEAQEVVFTEATNPHTGIYTYKQHLFVIDTVPPVVSYQGDTVFYVDAGCSVTVALPVTVSDDCGNTTVTWTFPNDDDPVNGEDSGFRDTDEEGSGIFSRTLTVGDYHVIYHVTDDCGNTTDLTVNFSVKDTIPPDVNCKNNLVVYLDENGVATANATDLNDGSTDNCCLNHFEIKRNDTACAGEDDDLNFGGTISFCCSDVGNEVSVTLKAIDCHQNENTCQTTVQVLDTIMPQCILPADTTIRCPDAPADVTDAVAMEAAFGAPAVTDNCRASIAIYETIDNRGECGDGDIVRRFRAVDDAGNETFCDQTIHVIRWSDYTIQVPPDISIVGCAIPGNLALSVSGTGCEDIEIVTEDTVIVVNNPDGSCIEKHITYTVTNNCEWNGTDDPVVLERIDSNNDGTVDGRGVHYIGNSNPGIYSYTQVVAVRDTIAPEVTYVGSDKYCTSETSCSADVLLDIEITDDCSRKFSINWQLFDDANGNGELDGSEQILNTGTGVFHDSLAIQEHLGLVYEVADQCGNTTYENVSFRVYDCISPMIQCADPVTMSVDTDGNLVVYPGQFLEPFADGQLAHENCTEADSLRYSFLYNFALVDSIAFDCSNVGESYNFQVLVFDNAENFAGCVAQVNVVDQTGGCSGGGVLMTGHIATEEEEPVEDVSVGIQGNNDISFAARTNTDGDYTVNLFAGVDYEVTPELNNNTRNRVSTYDLIKIRDHILGVDRFDSPYKIIAGDANRSGGVTGMDMVEIRRYILWEYDEFPLTNSWRFVPSNYVFPNPQNPFENGLPESLTYRNVQDDIYRASFVAVPTGDVGSSSPILEERNEEAFVINALDEKATIGESFLVDFTAGDLQVDACQFTLEYDDELIDFEELIAKQFKEENFGLSLLDRGVITVSWNSNGDEFYGFDKDEPLFSIRFSAKKSARLRDALSINSAYTKAEAYRGDGSTYGVRLSFGNDLQEAHLALYQNIPNPFAGKTIIPFYLPEASETVLTVMDVSGEVLMTRRGFFNEGYNEIEIDRRQLSAAGVLYYRLRTSHDSALKKMILLK